MDLPPNQGKPSPFEAPPRLIAFYLPQFYPIPENDEWWGTGFTEWRSVVNAKPQFPGHYQPHLPGELGYYDLRLPEVRENQAQLAREYGIYGFCYYHYWFGGKRLLERPFQEVLNSGSPDFPFMLCWANEEWTRNWDATTGRILMEQTHSDQDDLNHIRWLLEAFADSRYIKIDGRPVMSVYRAKKLPNSQRTTDMWRREAQRAGFPDLYLCKVESHGDLDDPAAAGFDANIGFLPQSAERVFEPMLGYQKHIVFDYAAASEAELRRPPKPYKRFPAVVPNWDNTARRPLGAHILSGSTPESYEEWLRGTISSVAHVQPEENFVFIVAWNEWAEGNHLEPDERFGRRYLEATRRALTHRQFGTAGMGLDDLESPNEGEIRGYFNYDYSYAEDSSLGRITVLVNRLVDPHLTIVDLGAGAATISQPLMANGFSYHGMDIHPEALRLMRAAGIQASQCDLNSSASVVSRLGEVGNVGALLLIDVIEHLFEPQELLSQLSQWSLSNGSPILLISVPNVAHFDVGLRLLFGRWDTSKTGLLDSTHLRFFYQKTLELMCARTGWRIVAENNMETLQSDQHSERLVSAMPSTVFGVIRTLSQQFNEFCHVQQYVWALTPVPMESYPRSYFEAVEQNGDVPDRLMKAEGTPSGFQELQSYMTSVGLFTAEDTRRAVNLDRQQKTALSRRAMAHLMAKLGRDLLDVDAVTLALSELADRYAIRADLQEAFGYGGTIDAIGLLQWAENIETVEDYDAPVLMAHIPAFRAALSSAREAESRGH